MKFIKAWLLSLVFMAISAVFYTVSAQNDTSSSIEMADTMRAEGKIYVVVLVVAIVFTGLIIYAVNTDRKVSKLEKEISNLKSGKDS